VDVHLEDRHAGLVRTAFQSSQQQSADSTSLRTLNHAELADGPVDGRLYRSDGAADNFARLLGDEHVVEWISPGKLKPRPEMRALFFGVCIGYAGNCRPRRENGIEVIPRKISDIGCVAQKDSRLVASRSIAFELAN